MKGDALMSDVLPIAEAKKHFPSIIREASENLKLYRVANAQRRDAPRAVVIGEEALRVLIGEITFSPQWEEDTEHGLWSVVVEAIGIYGQGPTRDDARGDLLEAAIEFADLYLEDIAYYFRHGRKDWYRYALAIALAAGDQEKLVSLFGV